MEHLNNVLYNRNVPLMLKILHGTTNSNTEPLFLRLSVTCHWEQQ